jgi:pantetheine-phosphate adenylyltransferase
MGERIALYPGSFDPITNGHLDIIRRGAKMFDKLYVVLSDNIEKNSLFSLEERLDIVSEATLAFKNVEVIFSSDELTVDFANKKGATAILRGLRNNVDFDYEYSMAATNSELNDKIETVFLMSKGENLHITSSLVKEVAKFSGSITKFVPPCVKRALESKFEN